jgi:hypothetical protein
MMHKVCFSDLDDPMRCLVQGELVVHAELDESGLEAVHAWMVFSARILRRWLPTRRNPGALEATLSAAVQALRKAGLRIWDSG